MLKQPRFIMLDWGGTLVRVDREPDTFAPTTASVCETLRQMGIPVSDALSDNLFQIFSQGMTQNSSVANLVELDSKKLLEDWARNGDIALPGAIDKILDALWTPWVGCLDPMDGVHEVLATLRERGIALGLVSNCAAPVHMCHAELARQGLAEYLSFTLFSSELGVRKPHPRLYEVAFSRASACAGYDELKAGEIVFVGDTPTADITGPSGAGMRTVLLRTGFWQGDEGQLETSPDCILDSVHDLPKLWS